MARKLNAKESMRENIFRSFANSDLYNTQENEKFWAIDEGRNRVPKLRYSYRLSHAQKEHQCVRGCKIRVGEKYFPSTESWSGIKICANCMAMILYFLEAWNLPAYEYDSWDEKEKRPHLAEDGELWKDMRDAVENL